MTVGTTNFSIAYDNQASLYKMSHLHEPRKIPSYDKLGNKLDNPSAECYYIQTNTRHRQGYKPHKISRLTYYLFGIVLL